MSEVDKKKKYQRMGRIVLVEGNKNGKDFSFHKIQITKDVQLKQNDTIRVNKYFDSIDRDVELGFKTPEEAAELKSNAKREFKGITETITNVLVLETTEG